MFGNYSRLSGGLTFEALRTFTGMPVEFHLIGHFQDQYPESKIWDMIVHHDSRNHLISGGINKAVHGLAAGHAYSILGAV